MLHKIDNQSVITALGKVVELQRRLIAALCLDGTGVADITPRWLDACWQGVDGGIDADFAKGFCGNKDGPRRVAMRTVAAASKVDKQTMLSLWDNHLNCTKLYETGSGYTIHPVDTSREPFISFTTLLVAFYEHGLAPEHGYPFQEGKLDRPAIGRSFPEALICPYCDGTMRLIELDHFLPKSLFPCLSCHPLNLVPVCHDCNSFLNKGNKVPLATAPNAQGETWFHPYQRSGAGVVVVAFEKDANRKLTVTLTAAKTEDQVRAANVDELFKLSPFWARHVMPDLRLLPREIRLSHQEVHLAVEDIRGFCRLQHGRKQLAYGIHELSLYRAGLYRFVANDEDMLRDILLQLAEDKVSREAN